LLGEAPFHDRGAVQSMSMQVTRTLTIMTKPVAMGLFSFKSA
jgi:hypothetical protein